MQSSYVKISMRLLRVILCIILYIVSLPFLLIYIILLLFWPLVYPAYYYIVSGRYPTTDIFEHLEIVEEKVATTISFYSRCLLPSEVVKD